MMSSTTLKFKVRSVSNPTRVLVFTSAPNFKELVDACIAKLGLSEESAQGFSLWYRDNEYEDLEIIDQNDLDACIEEARILQEISDQGSQDQGLKQSPLASKHSLRVFVYFLSKGQSIDLVLGSLSFGADEETFNQSCTESSDSNSHGFIEVGASATTSPQNRELSETSAGCDQFLSKVDWTDFGAMVNDNQWNAETKEQCTQPQHMCCQDLAIHSKMEEMLFEFLSSSSHEELKSRFPIFAALYNQSDPEIQERVSRVLPALQKIPKNPVEVPTQSQQNHGTPTPSHPLILPHSAISTRAGNTNTKPVAPRRVRAPEPVLKNSGFEIVRGIFDGVSAAFSSLSKIEFEFPAERNTRHCNRMPANAFKKPARTVHGQLAVNLSQEQELFVSKLCKYTKQSDVSPVARAWIRDNWFNEVGQRNPMEAYPEMLFKLERLGYIRSPAGSCSIPATQSTRSGNKVPNARSNSKL